MGHYCEFIFSDLRDLSETHRPSLEKGYIIVKDTSRDKQVETTLSFPTGMGFGGVFFYLFLVKC